MRRESKGAQKNSTHYAFCRLVLEGLFALFSKVLSFCLLVLSSSILHRSALAARPSRISQPLERRFLFFAFPTPHGLTTIDLLDHLLYRSSTFCALTLLLPPCFLRGTKSFGRFSLLAFSTPHELAILATPVGT